MGVFEEGLLQQYRALLEQGQQPPAWMRVVAEQEEARQKRREAGLVGNLQPKPGALPTAQIDQAVPGLPKQGEHPLAAFGRGAVANVAQGAIDTADMAIGMQMRAPGALAELVTGRKPQLPEWQQKVQGELGEIASDVRSRVDEEVERDLATNPTYLNLAKQAAIQSVVPGPPIGALIGPAARAAAKPLAKVLPEFLNRPAAEALSSVRMPEVSLPEFLRRKSPLTEADEAAVRAVGDSYAGTRESTKEAVRQNAYHLGSQLDEVLTELAKDAKAAGATGKYGAIDRDNLAEAVDAWVRGDSARFTKIAERLPDDLSGPLMHRMTQSKQLLRGLQDRAAELSGDDTLLSERGLHFRTVLSSETQPHFDLWRNKDSEKWEKAVQATQRFYRVERETAESMMKDHVRAGAVVPEERAATGGLVSNLKVRSLQVAGRNYLNELMEKATSDSPEAEAAMAAYQEILKRAGKRVKDGQKLIDELLDPDSRMGQNRRLAEAYLTRILPRDQRMNLKGAQQQVVLDALGESKIAEKNVKFAGESMATIISRMETAGTLKQQFFGSHLWADERAIPAGVKTALLDSGEYGALKGLRVREDLLPVYHEVLTGRPYDVVSRTLHKATGHQPILATLNSVLKTVQIGMNAGGYALNAISAHALGLFGVGGRRQLGGAAREAASAITRQTTRQKVRLELAPGLGRQLDRMLGGSAPKQLRSPALRQVGLSTDEDLMRAFRQYVPDTGFASADMGAQFTAWGIPTASREIGTAGKVLAYGANKARRVARLGSEAVIFGDESARAMSFAALIDERIATHGQPRTAKQAEAVMKWAGDVVSQAYPSPSQLPGYLRTLAQKAPILAYASYNLASVPAVRALFRVGVKQYVDGVRGRAPNAAASKRAGMQKIGGVIGLLSAPKLIEGMYNTAFAEDSEDDAFARQNERHLGDSLLLSRDEEGKENVFNVSRASPYGFISGVPTAIARSIDNGKVDDKAIDELFAAYEGALQHLWNTFGGVQPALDAVRGAATGEDAFGGKIYDKDLHTPAERAFRGGVYVAEQVVPGVPFAGPALRAGLKELRGKPPSDDPVSQRLNPWVRKINPRRELELTLGDLGSAAAKSVSAKSQEAFDRQREALAQMRLDYEKRGIQEEEFFRLLQAEVRSREVLDALLQPPGEPIPLPFWERPPKSTNSRSRSNPWR